MAVLSKPFLRQRLSTANVKSIINDLTTLYLHNRTRISRAVYLTLFIALINRVRNAIAEQKAAAQRREVKRSSGVNKTSSSEGEATGRKKVELNREFFKNLLRLLRICIPGWKSKELRLIISHSIFLVLRTMISLYVAKLDGELVSSLVRGKGKEFLTGLVWWMCVAVPATFTNSMVCQASLSTLKKAVSSRMEGIKVANANDCSFRTTNASCLYSTAHD
jgi:ATP-binding cassette subfamily D (ALD) long-chain fatty acid import protein